MMTNWEFRLFLSLPMLVACQSAADPSPKLKTSGDRIDLMLASEPLASYCRAAEVFNRPEFDRMSDHYPVRADFSIPGPEAGATRPLRIISYNVLEGFRNDPERMELVGAWLREQKPDVIAFQELNGFTPERLREWAVTWGHGHVELLRPDKYSTGLTSREPITGVRRLREGFWHGLLYGETQGMRVYVVHYAPGRERDDVRAREMQLTLSDMDAWEASALPILVLGDFNSYSPHDYPNLDHPRTAPARSLLDRCFVDLVFKHRNDGPLTPSHPTRFDPKKARATAPKDAKPVDAPQSVRPDTDPGADPGAIPSHTVAP